MHLLFDIMRAKSNIKYVMSSIKLLKNVHEQILPFQIHLFHTGRRNA